MSKPGHIELPSGETIGILHEDRSILAIDKPRGWMLAPDSWRQTSRNLQQVLATSIRVGDFWARSRNLRFLRFVHRLDAETSGVLLCAKNTGALPVYSRLFESRQMDKTYLAVVEGIPARKEWTCELKLAPDPRNVGRTVVDKRKGKEALTQFQIVMADPGKGMALVEAHPLTGRTHQIRVHLAESRHPVVGDPLYGTARQSKQALLGLRAVSLAYLDPFTKRRVTIQAPIDEFLREYGLDFPAS